MKTILRKTLCLILALALLTGAGLAELAPDERADDAFIAERTQGSDYTLTSSTSWKSKVVLMDWYKGGSKVLKKGKYGYLYDIKTGQYVKIKRMGGKAHADVEPATREDTAKLKKMGYSWKRRPGILYAKGKYVACSFATQPHGDQTISSNGFDGQFCLHMINSKTHGSDQVDSDHQAAVKKAYNWAH